MAKIFEKSYEVATKSNLKTIYFLNQLKKQFKLTDAHLQKLPDVSFFNNTIKKGDIMLVFLYVKDFDIVNKQLECIIAFTKLSELKLFKNDYLASIEIDKDIPTIIHNHTAKKILQYGC